MAILSKSSIIQKSLELGFCDVGVSKVEFLKDEAPILEKWLKQGNHREMDYMANHFEMRLNPEKLVPNAKSVISFILNYYPQKKQNEDSSYKISKYAYGRDYHKVFRAKLKRMFEFLKEIHGNIEGRFFVDSAPIMDKVWAKKSGLGWMGKNSNIIHPKKGSFFFIGHIVSDIEFDSYDIPIKDYCGTCTKCIDACPTQAITPYQVNGSKCISYLTIELEKAIPNELKSKTEGWIFGCDICQDVCPWNRFSSPSMEIDFKPRSPILEYNNKDWEELSADVFIKHFSGTPLMRAGFEKLKWSISS